MIATVRRGALRSVALIGIALGLASCQRKDRAVGNEIHEVLSAPRQPPNLRSDRWNVVRQIYADRDFQPLWTTDGRPREDARQLIIALCGAERDGLRPGDYGIASLKKAIERTFAGSERETPGALATFDLELTSRFVNYGADLLVGRLAPAAVDSGWFITARRSGADSVLRLAARGGDFAGMTSILRPKRADYDELAKALAVYRTIQEKGGWPRVPGNVVLKRGSRGPAIAALRRRLEIGGDLPGRSGARPVYDDAVAGGVARFQLRHGIAVDSTVTPQTLLALNTPVEYWIRQIEINLERYRWLPPTFGSKYVIVNIPDYHLFAFDEGKPVLNMRVIVGQEYDNATPVFADSMSYIVFRPQWYVPRRILVDEVIPQARGNIPYLADHGFEVVRSKRPFRVIDPATIDWWAVDTAKPGFHVRQKSGSANPLGRVKFMFPNQFSVYLHDTPAAWLFQQPHRTLSHGCVRVQRPVELADFLLAGQDGWNDSTIRAAMMPPDTMARLVGMADSQLPVGDSLPGPTVRLKQKVPVYILYLTAYMRDGGVNFRGDPYGKDAQAQSRLAPPHPLDRRFCEEILKVLGPMIKPATRNR